MVVVGGVGEGQRQAETTISKWVIIQEAVMCAMRRNDQSRRMEHDDG